MNAEIDSADPPDAKPRQKSPFTTALSTEHRGRPRDGVVRFRSACQPARGMRCLGLGYAQPYSPR